MRKIILLIGILMGIPFATNGQNEMYFFSSPKKEEPKKEVSKQKQVAPQKRTTNIFIPSGSTVVVHEKEYAGRRVAQEDLVDQYNRRNQIVISGDQEYEYIPPTNGGEWLYDGFEGSASDYYDAERVISSRDRRYAISISSPYYWDVVYGLNSWDWNVYVDNWDAYIFPRFSNPSWSSWKFGPRSGFGFSFGYNSWNPWYNSYYPYYNSWDYWGYRPNHWGWGSWYDPYYPSYWGWGGYPSYYSRRNRGYRDYRRYDNAGSWGSTTRQNRVGNYGGNRYNSTTRNRSDFSTRSRDINRASTTRDNQVRVPSTRENQNLNSGTNRQPRRYLNDRSVRVNSSQSVNRSSNVRMNSNNRSSIQYTRPSSTRSNNTRSTTRSRDAYVPSRSNTPRNNYNTNTSRSTRSYSPSTRSTTRSSGSSFRSGGGSSRSSGTGSTRSTRSR